MILWMTNFIIMVVFILMAIAFYTLIEQKMLSLTQNRLGPNKFSVQGILQPLLDGVKLILKENGPVNKINMKMILFVSSLFFIFMVQMWLFIPQSNSSATMKYSALAMLIVLSLMSYILLMTGILSKSKFAMLGSIRASAQTMSYEISLAFILLSTLLLWSSANIKQTSPVFTPSVLLIFLWWTTCMAECNRAPFDFAEGESELISGFNIEYSSRNFIFIFLGEYGMMLVFSLLTSALIFNKSVFTFVFFMLLFLIMRSSFPRFRYDMLMKMCWLLVLPVAMSGFFMFLIIK